MANARQLLIIYNADASIRGKLTYAYRKFSTSADQDPACAACDITHGGLSLREVPGWTKTKSEIEGQGLQVVQWHRDEIEPDVRTWIGKQEIRYPVALTRNGKEDTQDLKVVANSSELAGCGGDATRLVALLKEKGVLQGEATSSL